jgi:hypothetical protein
MTAEVLVALKGQANGFCPAPLLQARSEMGCRSPGCAPRLR